VSPSAVAMPSVAVPPVPTPAVPTTEAMEDEPANVYYATCADAKRAGAAPLYRGEPGYRKALDRDGDGVACES
jgi:micrococcal nuclease